MGRESSRAPRPDSAIAPASHANLRLRRVPVGRAERADVSARVLQVADVHVAACGLAANCRRVRRIWPGCCRSRPSAGRKAPQNAVRGSAVCRDARWGARETGAVRCATASGSPTAHRPINRARKETAASGVECNRSHSLRSVRQHQRLSNRQCSAGCCIKLRDGVECIRPANAAVLGEKVTHRHR